MKLTIIKAIKDEKLFRPLFKDLKTWAPWICLLKALFGLPLTKKELDLYQRSTGRKKAPKKPFHELWAIIGRRGGKSFVMSLTAVFLALFYNFREYLAPGERGVIQIIAADRSQAKVIFKYISATLNSNPVFERYIQNETKEAIELTTCVDIEVMTCSFRTIRGRTVVCAIADEIAFWRVEGANPDREILTAIRPSMATIPNSLLLVISSPYARSGVLYEHHRDYYGKDDPDILVWQADTLTMNPTISQRLIDRETEKDPSAARAEWQAQFREDIENFLTVEVIESLVISCRRDLPPNSEHYYYGFCDPSGGRHDAFTLAIGHYEEESQKYVIDLLRAWEAPFNPEEAAKEAAEILKQYDLREVMGDRYAGSWVTGAFDKAGIDYECCPIPKSDLYLAFEAFCNMGRVELPDNKKLVSELRSLERRRGKSGKDSVDHPPRGKDDRANAVAGLCYVLAKEEDKGGEIGRTIDIYPPGAGPSGDGGFWIPVR